MTAFEQNEERRRQAKSSYKDLQKHFVRQRGWLPVFERYQRLKGRKLKYLTLCAKDALDVRYFRRHGVLFHDATQQMYPTVGFIEGDSQDYATIVETLGKTLVGIKGNLEEIVLEPENHAESHKDLRASLPYDIINLDFTGDVVPASDHPHSRTMRAIERLVQLQRESGAKRWHLFLTFNARYSRANKDATASLCKIIEDNLANDDAKAVYGDRLPPAQLLTNEYPEFIRLGIAKLIAARSSDFYAAQLEASYQYSRRLGTESRYDIVKLILGFNRLRRHGTLPNPGESLRAYTQSVRTVFGSPAIDVRAELNDQAVRREIREDLAPVLKELDEDGVVD